MISIDLNNVGVTTVHYLDGPHHFPRTAGRADAQLPQQRPLLSFYSNRTIHDNIIMLDFTSSSVFVLPIIYFTRDLLCGYLPNSMPGFLLEYNTNCGLNPIPLAISIWVIISNRKTKNLQSRLWRHSIF